MGLLSTRRPDADDPKCQTDAYISHGRHLYEVIGLTADSISWRLHVRNCRTEYLTHLTADEVESSHLERAAQAIPEAVPAEWQQPESD